MNAEAPKNRRAGLNLIFGASAAVLAALVLWAVYVIWAVDRSMEIYDLSHETKKLASTLYFEKMTAIAQVTIGVIGGTWALLMFGDRAKVTKGLSRWYFVLASIAFGASLVTYSFGYDFIVARLFHHGAFDIDTPFVADVRNCQVFLFVKGCLDLVGTALSPKGNE